MDQQHEKPEPTARERILSVCEELKITMDSEFVPWSKSRNKGEKTRSLNWKVRLYRGREKIPSVTEREPLPFLEADFNAGALNYPDFESWASEFGYDTDSRKAERTYRADVETGIKLRYALGEDGLRKLREAARDF